MRIGELLSGLKGVAMSVVTIPVSVVVLTLLVIYQTLDPTDRYYSEANKYILAGFAAFWTCCLTSDAFKRTDWHTFVVAMAVAGCFIALGWAIERRQSGKGDE